MTVSQTEIILPERPILGRYQVVRALGRGGMGIVYLAQTQGAAGFRMPVVVKQIVNQQSDDGRLARMFVREARIMARLRHPNIVGAIDFAEENDSYVLVLEYVHGFDLAKWHRYVRATRGPFRVDLALHIVLTLLDALAYAHDARGSDGAPLGVIHRDVTPSNVLIDVTGQVKLADFGIASATGDVTDGSSESIRVKGKFPYLAPELFGGTKPSPGTDVYSVGVILHELLVGRNEFRTGDVASTIKKVLDHVPTPVAAVRDDLPDGLDGILDRALTKDISRRFDTASDFAAALRGVIDVPDHIARARLEEAAARDFRDPTFPATVGAAPLDELEAAWEGTGDGDDERLTTTQARVEIGHDGMPIVVTESGTTALEKHAPEPLDTTPHLDDHGPRGANRGMLYALVGLVVVVGGGGAYLALRHEPEPQVVVVRGGDVRALDDESPPSGDPPPREADDVATDPLTAALAERQAAISGCFERHAASVEGSPEIALRLRVELDGTVSSAEVLPATLTDTELGRCLVSLARTTVLPAPTSPLTIRLPITATRVEP